MDDYLTLTYVNNSSIDQRRDTNISLSNGEEYFFSF